jgi:outer membrane protein assembly factor BamB
MSEQHTVPSIDETEIFDSISSTLQHHDTTAPSSAEESIAEPLTVPASNGHIAIAKAEQAAGEACEDDQSDDAQAPTAKMPALRHPPSELPQAQSATPDTPIPLVSTELIEHNTLVEQDESFDDDDLVPTAKMVALPKFSHPLPIINDTPETDMEATLSAEAASDSPFPQPGDHISAVEATSDSRPSQSHHDALSAEAASRSSLLQPGNASIVEAISGSSPSQPDNDTLSADAVSGSSLLQLSDDTSSVEATSDSRPSQPHHDATLSASEEHTEAITSEAPQPGDDALPTSLSKSAEHAQAETIVAPETPQLDDASSITLPEQAATAQLDVEHQSPAPEFQPSATAQNSEAHPLVAFDAQFSEIDVDAIALLASSLHPTHALPINAQDAQLPAILNTLNSTVTHQASPLTAQDAPENVTLYFPYTEVSASDHYSHTEVSEVDVSSIDLTSTLILDYKKDNAPETSLDEVTTPNEAPPDAAAPEHVECSTTAEAEQQEKTPPPVEKLSVADVEVPQPSPIVEGLAASSAIPIPSSLSYPIPQTLVSKPLAEQEEAPTPVALPVQQEEAPIPTVLPTQVAPRQASIVAHWRALVSCVLLLVLLLNAVLLWRDLTTTHLYVNVLNTDGTLAAQQDIGSYMHSTLLTSPASNTSTAFVGVHDDTAQGVQQVLTLTGNSASWHVNSSFSAPLTAGSLTVTPGGQLLIESADGMQVMTADGQLLWQVQGPQPTRGAHPFQPASDSTSVYTVRSVTASQVAAYDLPSGKMRWTQTLDDTLNYAPPFLLAGTTLYIASDTKLYALNSADGTLKWSFPYTARTLLLANNGQGHLLLAAGVHGLVALDPAKGTPLWTFTGQVNSTLTPPQLYQATLAYQGAQQTPIVYTTGIAWQMPEVREQLWLYAVNAATGQPLWSQQLATDFTSADAGRTLMPLLDGGLVIVQVQTSANEQCISAFNALTGTPTWQVVTVGSEHSAPAMLQTPDGSILAFTLITGSGALLHSPSLPRIGMLCLLLLCLIALPLVWLLPLSEGQKRIRFLQKQFLTVAYTASSTLRHSFAQIRQQRPSLGTVLAIILPLVACISTVAYTQLHQPQASIYQADITTGGTLWHQVTPSSTQTLGVDSQGDMIVVSTAAHVHQLEVINSAGSVLWHSFSSEGSFALSTAPSPNGALLVSLSGPTSLDYQYAPDDPSYTPALASMLAFYRFDLATGKTLWQRIAAYPGEQQSPVVLGADSNYIYITSLSTPSITTNTATRQLFAFNQTTGTVDWRIFGPTENTQAQRDKGALLFRQRQVIWQVAGVVYAIDSTMGQIEWRHPLIQDASAQLAQEEQQAVLAPNALIVMRSDTVYALDTASGDELWALAVPPPVSGQTSGLAMLGHALLIYSNGQLAAYDLTDRHLLWQQQQLGAIHSLNTASDGSTIYLATLNAGNTHSPSVIALDAQTGSIHWTLALPQSATFTASTFYSQGSLVIGLCLPSNGSVCATQQLLAVDTSLGAVAWHVDAQQIANLALSPDGTAITYQLTRSQWANMLGSGK